MQFVTEHIEQYYVRMKGLYLFLRENEQGENTDCFEQFRDEEQEISDKAWRIPTDAGDIRIL